jgi:hypothetical protein
MVLRHGLCFAASFKSDAAIDVASWDDLWTDRR